MNYSTYEFPLSKLFDATHPIKCYFYISKIKLWKKSSVEFNKWELVFRM